MPIHEATYTIFNVGSSNFISLPSNDRNEVVACSDASISNSKWNVIPLRGLNRYHIRNDHDQSLYAWCKIAAKGESVVGSRLCRMEWVIKETKKSDHYIISPADDEDFFWGLEDNKTDTPVELKNGPATVRQNLWQFHHHSGPLIVENIIDDLQLTLDWLDTTGAQTPFKAHISGTLQRSDLPADASISFPKSLRLVWKKLILGHANLKATYGASQADECADNALITPTSDHAILIDFVRALLREKSIDVEVQTEEVTVHAGHKDYPAIRANFRKCITFIGFDYLKGQIAVEKIRITGSDHNGSSLTALTHITIKNPSNISVLIDEMPIEVYYQSVKMADLTLPSFKLHHSSSGIEFRVEVPVKFQPENSHDKRCKEFIAKYITTAESLEISLSLERTMVKLASSTISIPRFKLTSTIEGLDQRFVTGATAHISLVRVLLMRNISFSFDVENPIDTPVTITLMEAEVSRKSLSLFDFRENLDMTAQVNTTLTSQIFRKANIHLTLRKMITFIGKKEVKVEIAVRRSNVSIGKFHLQDLTFNKLTDIRTTLRWSL